MQDISTAGILKSLEAHYQNGSFDDARELLLQERESLSPFLFHYNLGTLHTKTGHLEIGRYHLEKALKESPFSKDAMNNLAYVESKLNLDDLSTSRQVLDTVYSYSLRAPTEIFLSGMLILVFIFGIYVLKNKSSKIKKTIYLMIVLILPFAGLFFHLKNYDLAIALKETPIREGPSDMYQKRFSIRAGSKLVIGKRDGRWLYVERPVEKSGWATTDEVALY